MSQVYDPYIGERASAYALSMIDTGVGTDPVNPVLSLWVTVTAWPSGSS
jgi:hypothetical protein